MSTSPRSRSGQPALEFMTMFSLALLIFGAFYGFFAHRQGVAFDEQRQRVATAIGNEVSFELDLALTEGNGFSRTFTLRDQVLGAPYNVTVGSGVVFVEYGDRSVVTQTAVTNVTGTAKPGTNQVTNNHGNITITQP